jgi:DNA primase small subunit
MVSTMPHSVSPESTPAEDPSPVGSQGDSIKPEPETQDVAMEDVPAAAAAETNKVKLEELFDDVDSDPEFPSSAPAPTSQEDASQPAPMYAPTLPPTMSILDN